MITPEKIDRINFLARKSRAQGLSPQEAEEQQLLRREYVEAYKASLKGSLEHTVVVRPDGSRTRLSDMKKKK